MLEWGDDDSDNIAGAKANAAWALARFASQAKHVDAVVAAGAILPLINVLKSATDSVVCLKAGDALLLIAETSHHTAAVVAPLSEIAAEATDTARQGCLRELLRRISRG